MQDIAWTRSGEGTPLYLQLARSLREHISSGAIDPGSALPSERDLSEMAGLSRVTVRKGIEQLIDEGVLVRKQGSGTFVARRIETPGGKLSSFSDETRSRGENPGVVWTTRAMPSRPRKRPPRSKSPRTPASPGWGASVWPEGNRWRSNMP